MPYCSLENHVPGRITAGLVVIIIVAVGPLAFAVPPAVTVTAWYLHSTAVHLHAPASHLWHINAGIYMYFV
ncbi:MAG: hypothetical protein NXY57DRAFT_970079 [Lentinula lateritia]|nr:MAG: hypothetical protein NXY57DRAFT_970079 [Lentinula lateritia]